MKRLLGGMKMGWGRVLAMAVISGALTGILNVIPALEGTSLTVPAVTPELWIVLALIIVLNCQKVWEAMGKVFLFFLVSQPLVYLVEVPFNSMGWELFSYYPRWGVATVLTIPAAFLAFQVKKGKWYSALILSAATGYLLFSAVQALPTAISDFPRMLLHVVFCVFFAFSLVFVCLPGKKECILALMLTAAAGLFAYGYGEHIKDAELTGSLQLESGHSWELAEPVAGYEIEISESGEMTFRTGVLGSSLITVENENGEKVRYLVENNGTELRTELAE